MPAVTCRQFARHAHTTALCLVLVASSRAAASEALDSPDGLVSIVVTDGGALSYSIRYRDADVLGDSTFAIEFQDQAPFGANVSIRSAQRSTVDTEWTRVWGRRTEVRNRYNEMVLRVAERDGARRGIDLTVRAYDEGIAFSYALPENGGWDEILIAEERSSFRFATTPTVWAAGYPDFHSSQETAFVEQALSELVPGNVYATPLLAQLARNRWAMLTEAKLSDWAGMYLTRVDGEPATLTSLLSRHPEGAAVAVTSRAPRSSPWRVVMLGDAPGDFLESDLVQNLNDPAAFDTDWIAPGKSAWDWWNGSYLPDAGFAVGKNTETLKAYVDFAAEMGWSYALVDAGWYSPQYRPRPGSTAPAPSILTAIPELDIETLIAYAAERGVRIWLWLHWEHARNEMAAAFPLYEQWGVAGVKIDYMDRDDQEMVNFYSDVMQLAAEHRLLVNFHGAYRPTGLSRTWPNAITREGILGNEYNKWSRSVTPEHNVTIPFTRGALGEMDFTPGGFLQKSVDNFRPQDTPPFVMGTRTHQLAMMVVYESAIQTVADSPYNYRSSPAGLDFLSVVPTSWDDTVVLNGYPGDYIAVARRSGDEWYVAAMSDEEPRSLELPLDFLGAGYYRADIWADTVLGSEFPDRLLRSQLRVTSDSVLTADMAAGGGYVVQMTPMR